MIVRDADTEDIHAILRLIRELAEGSDLGHEVVATEEELRRDLLGEHSASRTMVAELDGNIVGCLVWNLSYKTRVGKYGVYMSDLIVHFGARRQGVGEALVVELAKRCVENDWCRLDLKTHIENENAHSFYRSLGFTHREEIIYFEAKDDALAALTSKKTS